MIFPKNVSALILAAGFSSRMGHFKPLAPLGSTTALQRCVDLFLDSGISDIRVVVGHRHDNITMLLRELGIPHVLNSRFHEGMFSSVKAGLTSLNRETKAFFVLPVDIPLVRKSSIREMLEAFRDDFTDVIYPCFMGKRGHPPLISGSHINGILQFNQDGGLRGYLKDKTFINIEVSDEHILMDMDVPEQYSDMQKELEDYEIPSARECLSFLKYTIKANDNFIFKSKNVADIASKIAFYLKDKGHNFNSKLITAGSLFYSLSVKNPHNVNLVESIVDKFGHSILEQLLSKKPSFVNAADKTMIEAKIVDLAHRIAEEDEISKIDEWLSQCFMHDFEIQAIKSLKLNDSNRLWSIS